MIKSPFCGAYKIIILGHNHLCLTELLGSLEQRAFYDNIYRIQEHFKLDKDKMLEVIEERALVYTKDELLNILNKRIDSEENNSLTLLDYKTSSQKKYKNIDNILNDC